MDLIRKREVAAPPPAADPREFVMSDGSVDRMGDVIEPAGWRLDRFHRNPVALFNHDRDFPIGTWRDVPASRSRISAVAVTPSISGICTSIRMTSNASRSNAATASRPVSASLT